MSELAIPTNTAPVSLSATGANLIRESAAVMETAHQLATAVAGTQMIPKHFQGKPDECAAAMLYGASLGLDPMQSVRQIYVVHGQAALYARAMSALVLGAGHRVWTVESGDQSVTVAGSRAGSEHVETSTWTYDRAHKAGYTSNAKYKTDPQAMLYSKALSEVCRKIAPDVLSGVFSVEEMQMERTVDNAAERRVSPVGAALAKRDRPALAEPEPATVQAMTDRSRREMFALFTEKGVPEGMQLAGINHHTGGSYTSRGDLSEPDALRVIAALRATPTPEATPDV